MPHRKKNSPYWHYDFQIEGRRFHGSTGTTSKEEAKNIEAAERRKAVTSIKFPEQADMRLRDATGRYYQEHGKHKKSAADIFQKLACLTKGLGPDKTLRTITNMDIADYIAKRRGEMRKIKDGDKEKMVRVRSDSSVNREITLLRAVLNRAAAAWDIAVKMPNWKAHHLREPRGRIRSLTVDEETNLFKHLRKDFHPLVRFCLITGARVTSARMLTWKSVNRQAGEIRLEVKSKFMGDFHTLPITPEIAAVLDAVKGQHPIYVFTYLSVGKVARRREKGKRYPFARDGWRRTWAKALRDAGIEDFRFHDLRHTAATQMLRATKNLAAVKEVLGHRDVATTMRYAHVMKDDIRAALSRNIPEAVPAKEEKEQLKIVSSNG